jgi:hypothetical protein
MMTRGTPSIFLGPTGNIQGTYNFLSLISRLVIKRRWFDELPTLDSVIAGVMMAQICHYVMVHTATKQYMDATTPSKKQYGHKAGLCWFTDRGSNVVMKELTQFHTLNCFCQCNPATLTHTNTHNALNSLMLLTEKCTGKVKACACANGSVQQQHVAKEKAMAPTVTLDAIFIQSTIFAYEQRDVATCNILGAFLQVDNPDHVLMHLDDILAELMVKVAPHCIANMS